MTVIRFPRTEPGQMLSDQGAAIAVGGGITCSDCKREFSPQEAREALAVTLIQSGEADTIREAMADAKAAIPSLLNGAGQCPDCAS